MKIQDACLLLQIRPHERFDIPLLKKKYKKACLLHHPDKKGNDTEFIRVKEAYAFLLTRPEDGLMDRIEEKQWRLYAYWLSHIEHPLLTQYVVRPIEQHLSGYKTYLLEPTIENMLRKDIYYLEEEQLYIPLWHQELVFYKKIRIVLKPKLFTKLGKVELDEVNNLYVPVQSTDTCLCFGGISILITEEDRKRGRIPGKGIPRLSEGEKIYNVDHLADIIFTPV
jgi:hypothetical protein